ncbi:phage Gp37/Gp68 family protein [Candidatus Arthromitus sp. SFB-rat-Yit]|uniref:phage Gp37/Gp68 family protein n=1 Tax=Candidatus Arthromitus sp. SFB-rat-Yit TaxID=1041504 RepID=UPI000227A7D5|nr:phage Gp37/Gp68 family protein [Candidatus Arthromitus sp. SFB-rat-Yit]BAK80706.1 phage protein Gp37/Gp68 [Candidatus Arthromitus sp. SFB-rat-Yit]
MRTTKIEWTDRTWNPVTGCTKFSTGCAHCYAETMVNRLRAMGVAKYANGFMPTMHEASLYEPIKWKQPHTIFVCSMADLFHDEVPLDFIDSVMNTIRQTPRHRYQILTKRAERMAEYFTRTDIPQNVWLGVTVESSSVKHRIESLRPLQASVRFLSCEPLVEDIGELDLADAEEQGAAFFFKQWGTWGSDGVKRNKKANGKALDGKIIQMMPQLNMR